MKKLIKIFAPVLALFALAGCATKESDGTYPMGVMLPLSGDNAAAARETLNGMEIARDEINAAGGFSLNVTPDDDLSLDFGIVGLEKEYELAFNADGTILQLTVVPEPAEIAALLGGLCFGLAAFRRRR